MQLKTFIERNQHTLNIFSYAWSHGAGQETTKLPDGVGFPVGGLSKNQYVVLQVHYMHALEDEDFAGVKVKFTGI